MTVGREGSGEGYYQKGTRKGGREGQRKGTGRRGITLFMLPVLYFWLKSQYLQCPNINLELKVTADIFSKPSL